MIQFIGILILLLGFFIQPLSRETVPAQIVFWIGFYLILRFGKVAARYPVISRFALIGLTVHIAAVLILVLIGKFIMYPGTPHHAVWDFIMTQGDWVAYPFTRVFMLSFPYEAIDFPNRSIDLIQVLAGSSVMSFLDTLVYVAGGAGVGIIRKRMKDESASARPSAF